MAHANSAKVQQNELSPFFEKIGLATKPHAKYMFVKSLCECVTEDSASWYNDIHVAMMILRPAPIASTGVATAQ
tara:strand:+ start:229 stop:450 length:222 start_codon:yes stop_codon:yes gene_type:complete